MPPTDRLLEARKTYADIAEACRSLSERAEKAERAIAAVEMRVATLNGQVATLSGQVDQMQRRADAAAKEIAESAAAIRNSLWRPLKWMIVVVVLGGFTGALLLDMAASFGEWLRSAVASWWEGQ